MGIRGLKVDMFNPHGKPAGDIAKNHLNHAGPGRPAYEYDVRPWSRCELELDSMFQPTLNRYGFSPQTQEQQAVSVLRPLERLAAYV